MATKLGLAIVLLGGLGMVRPGVCSAEDLATVSVDVESLGRTIPGDFDGFSIEVDDSARRYLGPASSPNLVFYQLLENLGRATIRIGGDSTDSSCWKPNRAPSPAACRFTITDDDVRGFMKASAETGWGLIVGVNLAQNSAPWALQYGVEVVNAARATPGSKLLGFEFGNEPDLFSREAFSEHTTIRPKDYSLADLVRDWKGYVAAFKGNAATAAIPLAGPAFDNRSEIWRNSYLGPFIDGVGARNLGLATVHEYPTDTCEGDDVTIPQLLAESLMSAYAQRARGWVEAAGRRGLKLELDETHSTACSGKDGVDNVFAETVWGLDWLFTNFKLGFRRINFHMDDAFYSAVFVKPTRNPDGGAGYANTVAPFYYAMYAFSTEAENRRLLSTTLRSRANVKSYAVRSSSGGPVKVFIINKDLSASGTVVVTPSKRLGRASLVVVQAPSLDSKTTTYGGVSFDNQTGRLAGARRATSVEPDSNDSYSIPLDNASIAILTVSP